jgi:hypothetical protein
MEIIIEKEKKLHEIQEAFQAMYPYLKLEFYNKEHASEEGSAKRNTLDTTLSIESVQHKTAEGSLAIQGKMRVADLENAFEEMYGLSVQVFRKSNNTWLQTTTSDHLTLNELNQKASEKHEVIKEDSVDAMDLQDLE